jgi:LysR family hydrogen peroxide-inducible transcriptional activator
MADLPTIRQMECLVALAECRSFSRAADRLKVSQPALSAQIRGLEEQLGVLLVERRATGAELTPLGRECLAFAEAALQASRGFASFATRGHQRLNGRTRLGASPTVGPYLLPGVVAQLHRSSPDLRLIVRESAPETLVRELLDGIHDGVIAQLPIREDGLHVEELFRERVMVMMAADHPLARCPFVPVEELAGQRVLSLDSRFPLGAQTVELCRAVGACVAEEYQSGSLDALRLMVGMGAGIAFAPELYVRSVVRPGGEVVARTLRGRAIHRIVGLAWRRSFTHRETMDELAEVARETFAQLTSTPLTG